jgi:hypothetical protein
MSCWSFRCCCHCSDVDGGSSIAGLQLGCPRDEKKSVRTETNRNKICFAFVSVCFVKPKKNFRFVSVFRTYIETTETNRTVSHNPECSEKSIIYLPRILCLSYSCHIPVIFLSSCHPVIVAEC